MKTILFYFHGFGSSAQTDKVSKLRENLDLDVYAFDIDIDPVKAEDILSHQISLTLMDYLHEEDIQVIFVGTSLGGWWAGKLAKQFHCRAILINPAVEPQTTLHHLGVNVDTCAKYHDLEYPINTVFFLAEIDEVVDHTSLKAALVFNKSYTTFIVPNADHRFNDKFYLVQDYITKIG